MAPSVKKTLVHVIDDDEAVRDSIDAYLTLKGLAVETFCSAHELLARASASPDVLILDVNMPDIDGFMLIEVLREKGEHAPVIFITGLGDPSMRLRAERAGVAAFLDKPLNPPDLLQTLWRLLA